MMWFLLYWEVDDRGGEAEEVLIWIKSIVTENNVSAEPEAEAAGGNSNNEPLTSTKSSASTYVPAVTVAIISAIVKMLF